MEPPSYLVNSQHIYVVTLDTNAKIIFCNHLFNKKIAGSSNDLTGTNIAELISADDLLKLQKVLKDVIGAKHSGITDLSLKNGSNNVTDIRWEFSNTSNSITGIGYDSCRADDKMYSEEELSNIVINGFPGIFYLQDETGKYLKWNRNFETLSGYSAAEIPSLHPLVFFKEKDHELIINAIAKGFTLGTTEVEAEVVTRDGQVIPYFFNGRSINYEGKKCLIGVGIDITQQIKAQQEIKESEQKYHSLFQQASDPIMVTDFQGNFIDVNTAMCNMFGYTKEELLGMRIQALIDPVEIQTTPVRFDLLAKDQHIFTHRKMLHLNGNVIHVEANAKKFGENLVMAIVRDVTELKKAEENLVMQEKQLRLFVEQSPAAIAMFDNEMRYMNVSHRWLTEYHATQQQLTGNNHYELFPWIPQRWRDVHQRCLAGATEKSEEDSYTNDDGTTDWLRWEVHPWHNASGEIGGIIMLTEIITQKKLLEAAILEQKVQEQKKISRAIIKAQEKERNHIGQELHDNVNQILAGTKLYMKIAAQGNEAVEKLIKYPMELIDSSIHEIRMLSSRQVTPVKNINLKDLVCTLLGNIEKNTRLKTQLNYNITDQPIADDLKLNIYRIIQEQINNVVKYANAKNISISIVNVNSRINVEVADDGIGFNTNKKREGIGISNLINRVEAFNGD
ncbi:MAG: PAS domain S-box protein, partial [Ferruginibacter sp.]